MCRSHHFPYSSFGPDVSRVYAQARRAGNGGFNAATIVKMNIRDDGNGCLSNDRRKRLGRLFVRARDPNNISARRFELTNLGHRRRDIMRERVGHRLNSNRRTAPDRNAANHHLTGVATENVAVGSDAHGGQDCLFKD